MEIERVLLTARGDGQRALRVLRRVLARNDLFELRAPTDRELRAPTDRELRAPTDGERTFRIDARAWQAPDLDLFDLDIELARVLESGPIRLWIDGSTLAAPSLPRVAVEIVTHLQRLLPRRNEASRTATFDRVLERHRAAHDRSKPLVRADYEHARDVWQWVLRLEPEASLALQVAALFHDVERLVSEADVRIEHHARDYQSFKDAHAHGGAAMTRTILAGVLDDRTLDRVAALVARHERPDADADLVTLNDADALSFFSVNVCGFLRYYGEAHTKKKLAYTLARLSDRGLRLLPTIRLRADVRALFDDVRRRAA